MSTPANIESNQNTADPIHLTENAIAKVYSLMQEENNPHLKLRIFITGGGCSGFQYGFSFEDTVQEDDTRIKKKGKLVNQPIDDAENSRSDAQNLLQAEIEVIIDALSLPYLSGAEVDYCQNIKGEYFLIRNNPKAKTTCGCGSSFSAN